LGFVDGKKVLNALDFQNHLILYGQIEPVAAIKFDAFILDRQGTLSFKGNVTQVELVTKAFFVR
jgi:hypothetical protein